MISLLHLNRIILIIIWSFALFSNPVLGEEEPANIWGKKENQIDDNDKSSSERKISIESSILSENGNKLVIKIDEDNILKKNKSVIGIFDPEKNNFNLDMWSATNGEDIKKVLKRIDKLKLSKLSEDLLFQVLFTNSYPPKKNLDSKEFLKIKIDWLINKKRIKDLELLLSKNAEVGNNIKAIKFLINEYLSSADIKSACEKTSFIDSKINNSYLDKFIIYCLVKDDRKEEAQLIFDLAVERGLKDNFFEDKINFLMGIKETTSQKILDDNLLNFYLSYITNDSFKYEPNDTTNKYIWRYLSSANLIEIENYEDENVVARYEKAAAQNSFESDEIFKIYLKIDFNFNQLVNSQELYKNLPNYKARALIYQSMLLSDNIERKINLAFLLKDLFLEDKIFEVYEEELLIFLKSLDKEKIPERYADLINKNLNKNLNMKIKFDNEILHRSKVIKHFLENNNKLKKTEKDLKSVYKKIKKNKKYFISIKDIIVLESLVADGVTIPTGLNYDSFSSELTVPQNLQDLVTQNQMGLLMLKIVEIIGEDDIRDLDPETVYFLNRILNELNLLKIRNKILSEVLPARA